MGRKCRPHSQFLSLNFILFFSVPYSRRGPAVRAPELKSGGPGFKPRPRPRL